MTIDEGNTILMAQAQQERSKMIRAVVGHKNEYEKGIRNMKTKISKSSQILNQQYDMCQNLRQESLEKLQKFEFQCGFDSSREDNFSQNDEERFLEQIQYNTISKIGSIGSSNVPTPKITKRGQNLPFSKNYSRSSPRKVKSYYSPPSKTECSAVKKVGDMIPRFSRLKMESQVIKRKKIIRAQSVKKVEDINTWGRKTSMQIKDLAHYLNNQEVSQMQRPLLNSSYQNAINLIN